MFCPAQVGYVSPDLFTHSVSYFAEAPLSHHDASRVALFVYSCVAKPDAKTLRLHQQVCHVSAVMTHFDIEQQLHCKCCCCCCFCVYVPWHEQHTERLRCHEWLRGLQQRLAAAAAASACVHMYISLSQQQRFQSGAPACSLCFNVLSGPTIFLTCTALRRHFLCPYTMTYTTRTQVTRAGGVWREVARLTESQLAALVREDGIDILVELTGVFVTL